MSYPFLFALTCLAAFRVWRFVAVDEFPPATYLREGFERFVHRHWGEPWAMGVACPWCSGFHISALTVATVWACHPLPMPALWFGAVSVVVGLLAQYENL